MPDTLSQTAARATEAWTTSKDGTKLFYLRWPVESPRASMTIIHGYAEHSARYNYVAAYLNNMGFDVFALDLRGHGRSEGTRGHVSSYSHYHDDVDALREIVAAETKAKKHFILGHSNGGLITLSYVVERKPQIEAFIVTGPFLGPANPVPPVTLFLGKIMAMVYPKLKLPTGIDAADLSTDPTVGERYAADPLVFPTATAGWFSEAMKTAEATTARAGEIRTPCLIMQGTEDRLADPSKAKPFYDLVGSDDKKYVDWPGMYHEILNEVEKDRVLGEIGTWLEPRL